MCPVQAIENTEQKRQIQLYFVWKSATKNRLIWHTSMRLSTKRIDQIVKISITVQQNIQGKLTRINYFKLASQGEIMIVLHLQKVTYSLSDEVSFFSDFQAFKSFLFMSRAFRKASCALRSSVRSASYVFFHIPQSLQGNFCIGYHLYSWEVQVVLPSTRSVSCLVLCVHFPLCYCFFRLFYLTLLLSLQLHSRNMAGLFLLSFYQYPLWDAGASQVSRQCW